MRSHDEIRAERAATRPRASPSFARGASLALLLLLACAEEGGGGAGESVEWDRETPGLFAPARRRLDASIRELEAVGYAGGYEEAPDAAGVVLHDPARAFEGLNLYCSGHAPEAHLTDMEGQVLHTWSLPYADVPGAQPSDDIHKTNAWRRVALLPDGGLLAIYEGLGLVRVDRDSQPLWYFPGGAHHDLEVQADGSIYVLSRRAHLAERWNADEPVLEDFVTVLSPAGEVLREVSVYACLEDSEFRDLLRAAPKKKGDILHTNSLEVLDGRLADRVPAFRAGNVLISMRHNDALAVLDLDARRAVWALKGEWRAQHHPTVLEDGSLLLFDNSGYRSNSQVLAIDPVTGAERWAYRGDPPESFYSIYCGTVERLPNGNTLITETCNGRALEVDSAGEPVWEFLSPHRAGDEGELIAALFEVLRIPAGPSLDWLER